MEVPHFFNKAKSGIPHFFNDGNDGTSFFLMLLAKMMSPPPIQLIYVPYDC